MWAQSFELQNFPAGVYTEGDAAKTEGPKLEAWKTESGSGKLRATISTS